MILIAILNAVLLAAPFSQAAPAQPDIVSFDYRAATPVTGELRVIAVTRGVIGRNWIWRADGTASSQAEVNQIKTVLLANPIHLRQKKQNLLLVWISLERGKGDFWSEMEKIKAEPRLGWNSGSIDSREQIQRDDLYYIDPQKPWLLGLKYLGRPLDQITQVNLGIAFGDPAPIPLTGVKIGPIRIEKEPDGDSCIGNVHKPIFGCRCDIQVPRGQATRDLSIEGFDKEGLNLDRIQEAKFFAPTDSAAVDWSHLRSAPTARHFNFGSTKPLLVNHIVVSGRDIYWLTFKNVHLKPLAAPDANR